MSVSHLFQKSESAITLIASPSWVWMFGGDRIMSPTSSCLMVATSSAGSLWFPSSSCVVAPVRNVHAALWKGAVEAGSYHVVEANVILKGKGGSEAGGDGKVGAGDDLEELEGVLRLALFLFEKGLGWWAEKCQPRLRAWASSS